MNSTVGYMNVPAIVNGRTIYTATLTVTAEEFPTAVVAIVNYREKLIGKIRFDAGIGFENVMATIRNLLTPEPSFRPACHVT